MICTLRSGLAVGLVTCCTKRSLTSTRITESVTREQRKLTNQGQNVSTSECREAGWVVEEGWLEVQGRKSCCGALQNRHRPLALWCIAGAEHRRRLVQQLVSLHEGADICTGLLR